jgi:hypothetical protein
MTGFLDNFYNMDSLRGTLVSDHWPSFSSTVELAAGRRARRRHRLKAVAGWSGAVSWYQCRHKSYQLAPGTAG